MTGSTTSTCDGRCCAVFPLRKELVAGLKADASTFMDGRFILDMLVPLTRRQAVARARRLGFRLPWKIGRTHRYFTCRHWDESSRLCTVYDDRPRMCSSYPYGSTCDHPDCCQRGEPLATPA